MSGQHCENYDVKQETVHCYPRMLTAVAREILGKQNSLFPSGPVITCLIWWRSRCRRRRGLLKLPNNCLRKTYTVYRLKDSSCWKEFKVREVYFMLRTQYLLFPRNIFIIVYWITNYTIGIYSLQGESLRLFSLLFRKRIANETCDANEKELLRKQKISYLREMVFLKFSDLNSTILECLKRPSQLHLCFCFHVRVWLLYFIRSMSKRKKSLWNYLR